MEPAEVRAFFRALGEGDFAAVDERLAEDVVLEFPGRRFGGRFEGKRRVLVFLRQNQRLFRGGLWFAVHWVGVCGDRAIAQWTNEGTTREGQSYANRGVTVLRIREGQVIEIQDYLDTQRVAEAWPR
jgi:ketosteroid isomerase-like protein